MVVSTTLDPEQIYNLERTGNANFFPLGGQSQNGGVNTGPTGPSDFDKFLEEWLRNQQNNNSSGPDHFFDVNPLDQAAFDASQQQNAWDNDFKTANFNWQKAQDDRDYALALGDLDLAKQKQADSNYWQQKSYELGQAQMASSERMNAADNAARVSSARIGADAQIASSQIAAMADRYAADQRLREGLANARNDEERNRIMLAHEREIAAIAKMEDDTKRAIASGEQKIGGFNAETARMAQMGDVALKNNQFLLDASKSPRDLFGLYFMQRGITPDWNSLAAGNPIQGQALQVYDPMKAYTPNITMPADFNIGQGQAYNDVGQASQMELGNNQYITGQQQGTTQPQQPRQMVMYASGTDPMGMSMQNQQTFTQPPTDDWNKMSAQSSTMTDPNSMLSVNTGWNPRPNVPFSPNRGPVNGNINQGSYTRPTGMLQNPPINNLTRPMFGNDMNRIPMNPNSDQSTINQDRRQRVGYTREPQFMVGDAMNPQNPWANGAKPEIIENPTNAPIRVKNTAQTALDFGIQPTQKRSKLQNKMRAGGGIQQQEFDPNMIDPIRSGMQQYNPSNFSPNNSLPRLPATPMQNPVQQPVLDNGQSYMLGPDGNWYMNPVQMQSPQQPPQQVRNIVGGNGLGRNIEESNRLPQFSEVQQPQNNMINRQPIDPRDWGQAWLSPQDPGMQMMTPTERIMQQFQKMFGSSGMPTGARVQGNRFAYGTDFPRYPVGTDNSQQYANMGMSQLWQNSSSNDYLNGAPNIPTWIQTLADYGAPIAPSLYNSVSGQTNPTLNMAQAFGQRGGGILPSLQTLNRQTAGENQLFSGYVDGPVGMPSQDVIDFIGRPTQNLRTAQRGSGTIM